MMENSFPFACKRKLNVDTVMPIKHITEKMSITDRDFTAVVRSARTDKIVGRHGYVFDVLGEATVTDMKWVSGRLEALVSYEADACHPDDWSLCLEGYQVSGFHKNGPLVEDRDKTILFAGKGCMVSDQWRYSECECRVSAGSRLRVKSIEARKLKRVSDGRFVYAAVCVHKCR
ncbi:hypothetical protein [Mandarin fish ranavirus]|nr:hypothetical protein [Mandarin fish ranavirus]WHA35540.1 hypothetical protein MSRaV_52L [Micropterus salmoides ranavirus]WHA35645.1 hypothetical protein SCRaV_52L [Siniperca chuatsi ranavirus]